MLIFLHCASSCFSGRTNKFPNVCLLNELSVQETFPLQHCSIVTTKVIITQEIDSFIDQFLINCSPLSSHASIVLFKSQDLKNVGGYQPIKIVEKSVYQNLCNTYEFFQSLPDFEHSVTCFNFQCIASTQGTFNSFHAS